MKLVALVVRCILLIGAAAPVTVLAWNPYDTDSARERDTGYAEQWGSPGFYGTPASPPSRDGSARARKPEETGWLEPGATMDQSQDRGESSWYRTDPRRSRDAWRTRPAREAPTTARPMDDRFGQRSESAPPGYADPWRYRPRPAAPDERSSGPSDHDRRADATPDFWQPPHQRDLGWQPSKPRYRFREDPELDALSRRSNAPEGYRYRPLTERELERHRRRNDDRYPEVRPQDLQPRGPWRSYEDEGTAFGYHPEDGHYRGERPRW